MAYNFESTFSLPLLNDIDSGRLSDARDWANAITNRYISTIKLGQPLGVPLVLPAPGLNPSGPPPPFNIGVSGFTTAEAKKRQMYNVIYAYFLSKELSLQKSSIQGLIQTSRQLIRKARRTQQKIQRLEEQSKLLAKQIQEIPTYLRDVTDGVKELISSQKRDLDNLIDSIKTGEFELSLGPQEFEQVFATELRLVDTIREFDLSDRSGLVRLTNFANSYSRDVNRIISSPKREDLIKVQIRRRLFRITNDILRYAQIPVSPSSFIDFANQVARQTNRLQRFARAISQLDAVERYVRPKWLKLKARIRSELTYLRKKLQTKITALQDKIKKRIEDYKNKRNESKQQRLYQKANKTINQEKKKNKKTLTKLSKKLKLTGKLTRQLSVVGARLIAFGLSLEKEFQLIKQQILRQYNRSEAVANNLSELQTQVTDQRRLLKESESVASYFRGNGFQNLVQFATAIVVETKCTAQDIINLFERKSSLLGRYGQELESIGVEFTSIQNSINDLFTTSEGRARRAERRADKRAQKVWIGERVSSLKTLFERVLNFLRPKVERTLSWIKRQFNKLKKFITTRVKKLGQVLEDFALTLLPLRSDVEDKTDRRAVLDAKKRRLQEKKKKIALYAKKLRASQVALPGIVKLLDNLNNGRYRLSENESSIRKISNGYFSYKRFDKPQAQQTELKKEKDAFEANFLTLLVIETIVDLLIKIGQALKQNQLQNEIAQFNQQIDSLSSQLDPSSSQSLELVKQIYAQPPTNLKEAEQAVNRVIPSVVDDVRVVNRVVDFEKRTLARFKQVFTSIIENRVLSSKYDQLASSGQTSGLFFQAYSELKKISQSLNKQQSFVLLLVRLLVKLFKKFIAWIKKNVNSFLKRVEKYLKSKIKKEQTQSEKELRRRARDRANKDAPLMTMVFGLAARLFWTGATWIGPTQSVHTVLSIGSFAPKMKALTENGASAFVRELAVGFENQLIAMQGVVTPPAITGIPPIQFVGYR